ncbi:MAG: ATP-binding protein [Desulforhopalus sp.]
MRSFIYKGARSGHDSETLRKILMLNLFLMIGVIFLVIMGSIAIFQEALLLGVADFVMGAVFFSLLLYLHRSGDEPTASKIGVWSTLFFFIFLFFVGGVHSTAYMWLYSLPLFSLYLLGLNQGMFVVCLLFCFCTGFLIVDLSTETVNVYTLNFTIRFIPSYFCVCMLAVLVESSRSQTRLELEEARSNLEERVSQRTAELELANEQLRVEIEERESAEQERFRLEAKLHRAEKMESLGRLAGGVAHDLNNVLSGIVSYPDLLLHRLPPDSDMREPLKNIHRSGKRAAAIVDDLLSLARRGITTRQIVHLNDVVTHHLVSPEFITLRENHPGVKVETHLANDLQKMSGSPVHLQKMVMNLLVNSFEAIEGEGRVVISTENRPLSPSVEYQGEGKNHIVLAIRDNGMGISEENIHRIFEPFYSSKVLGRSGTGLGMMVVWGTVKDHGGHLEVTSSLGEGTTITVVFPVLPEGDDEPQLLEKVSQRLTHGNNETILLVDDLADQRLLGKEILSSLGYRVKTVSSGEEAVEFMQNGSVNLVLLDMVMDPGMDGLETYLKIREIYPDQLVIIVSGYCETERMEKSLELGVRCFIKKPYTLEEIAETINRELRSHEGHDGITPHPYFET